MFWREGRWYDVSLFAILGEDLVLRQPGPLTKAAGMPVAPPNYSTLAAMITPAIFMTATGSLIISTSNRMSRIVDRIRLLERARR